MTNETRSRIRAYTEELPHMKEKVFGALLMLVIATMVTVTSTYAWVTLSRSPEVSNIATSMVSNGVLEIALAKPDGTQPDEYDIDESILVDNSVTVSNLQWGNLVNLSDSSYGIDNIALRPAQLNTTSLLTSPLWGAAYGEDGRITNLDSNYAFAKYNGSQFITTYEYGVRAIATYEATISDATQQAYNEKVQAVMTAHTTVNQTYSSVASQFSALGTMISTYATDKLNSSFTSLAHEIKNMIPIYEATRDAMEAQMDAYVALANLQHYLFCNASEDVTFTELKWSDLVNQKTQYNTSSASATSLNGHISLVGLTQFIADYNLLLQDIEHLEKYQADFNENGSKYYWGGYYKDADGNTIDDPSDSGYALNNIVDHLINYSTMTIDLENNGVETKVTSLSKDNAMALLGANNDKNGRSVYIYGGILYRLEQSSIAESYRINGTAACTIRVTYLGQTITVYGKAYTKASGACTFTENYTATLGTELAPKDAVALDTYGLTIDLWLRTNAEKTCLTLEGATSTDEQGNIVSYDGTNRVWGHTGGAALTTDSTTQGGGSCYIYYADTPEDMARSLDVLNAMKVAFVDSNGTLLATAEMDTANYWAVNGRITVPLVLDNQTKTTYTYVDSMNVEQLGRAITTLYTDLPVRVTAIVYLDGTFLTNDDVLAAAEIQGSLNIQFGSSLELKTLGSNALIDDYRTVVASASKTEMNYDTASVDAHLTTRVTLDIDGTEPTEVTAFFVRAINSTQGTREETMEFEHLTNEKGKWYHDYTFDAPGTYYLRHVRLDGVDYALEQPLKVEVLGFGLNDVSWSEAENNVVIRTSEDSHSTTVKVRFATDSLDKEPSSVQAHFVRDDGNTVSVPLTRNANREWVGTSTFTASGVYQLQYLVANGNRYIDLAFDDGSYRTLDMSLGMYVTVKDLTGSERLDFEDGMTYPKDVSVQLSNNAGVELEALENLVLYYSNGANLVNTISTNLTWDDLSGTYKGTLLIIEPGRYQFGYVQMPDGILTKYEAAPTYVVRSSKPLVYDTASDCSYDGIQYVPLTNDAVIDGIKIKNATSVVEGSAVVYCKEKERYYTAELVHDGSYTDADGNVIGAKWAVKLPTYSTTILVSYDEDGNPVYDQTQDGTWSLAALRLWNCVDVDGNDRTESNPLLWVDTGTIGQGYLATLSSSTKVNETLDFALLTTTVSSEVKVVMDPGNIMITTLGDRNITPFGTAFAATDTLMTVQVTDGGGATIPDSKVSVSMTLKYGGNTDAKTYGYAVSGSAVYTLGFALEDGEENLYGLNADGATIGVTNIVGDIDESWKYVGVYTVTGLTVSIDGVAVDQAYISGVPSKYTVSTMAPTLNNIKAVSGGLNTVTFGLNASGARSGEFLAPLNMTDDYVTIAVKATGNELVTMNNVVFDNLSVGLSMSYMEGSSVAYGGYTFAGKDPFDGYPTLTLAMTNSSSSVTGGTYTAPGNQVMPAGEYTPTDVVITLGENSTTTALSSIMNSSDIKNIKVYSVLPVVTITGVSNKGTMVNVNTNADSSTNYLAATSTFEAANSYDETNGHWAVVYMAYKQGAPTWEHSSADCDDKDNGSQYANYTAPTVTFQLSEAGSANATMDLKGDLTQTVNFLFKDENGSAVVNGTTPEVEIGEVTVNTDSGEHNEVLWGILGSCSYTEVTESASLLGSATVKQITSTVDGVVYTRTIRNPITVSQLCEENPTLTLEVEEGMTVTVTDESGKTYPSGADIPVLTELTVTVVTDFGNHHPVISEPGGVSDWTMDSEEECKSVYKFRIMDDVTLTATVSKYPTVTFQDEETNHALITMSAEANGVTETLTSGKTGVKPGSTVTVNVERVGNYCLPTLEVPDGIEWTSKSEGDYSSTYTFTMPDDDDGVKFDDPTAVEMVELNWSNNANKIVFYVEDITEKNPLGDENTIDNVCYVVPGHELSIRVTSNGDQGFINPWLVTPDAEEDDEKRGLTTALYTYTVPEEASGTLIELTADAEGYPELILVNHEGVTVTEVTNRGEEVEVTGSVGIKPGNNVVITLTANANYSYPKLSLAAEDVTVTTTQSEGIWTSTYSFAMPNDDVTATITAELLPTVTFDGTGAAQYTGYDGKSTKVYTGSFGSNEVYYVVPGEAVTVKATAQEGYYNPRISGNGTGLWESTYEFTMGDSNVNLTASATEMPTLTYGGDNASVSGIVYYGFMGAKKTDWSTSGVKVAPNTEVIVTLSANDDYHTPVLTNPSGMTRTDGDYAQSVYKFTIGTDNVEMQTTATENPTITYSRGSNGNTNIYAGSLTLVVDSSTKLNKETSHGESIKVRPGKTVQYTVAYDGDNGTFSVKDDSGVAFSDVDTTKTTGSFVMPERNLTFTIDSESSGCVTPDTLVTLADGSTKEIQYVTYEDQLLVWDFTSGEYVVKPAAILINMGEGDYRVITLEFANGATLRMMDVHGFFDMSANEFVFITEENIESYIGHKFAFSCDNGFEEVELTGYSVVEEYTVAYSIFSHEHYNAIVGGVLSITPYPEVDNEAFYNCWPIGNNMMYDFDRMQEYIDKHGLYSYKDWAEYGVTYEQYVAANLAYIKVVVGEGVLTFEEALELVYGFMPKS